MLFLQRKAIFKMALFLMQTTKPTKYFHYKFNKVMKNDELLHFLCKSL